MKTFGFDYAFALSINRVNQILRDNLSSIDMKISYTTLDPDSGSTLTLNGSISPWQIVSGGENTLINFNVPISEGFLSLEGGAITGHYDLTGVAVEMQVSLGWMGAGDQQDATGSGDATRLVFMPDNSKDKDNPGYVAAIQMFDPNHNLDMVAQGILKAFMADALISNKDNLKYIFANVNPTSANHEVLAKIAEVDAQRAQRVAQRLQELIADEDAFFTWIEESPQHSTLFIKDPVSAIKQALPNLPTGFFDGWSA